MNKTLYMKRIKDMLNDKRGKRLDKYVPDYVVFDLETTGIAP